MHHRGGDSLASVVESTTRADREPSSRVEDCCKEGIQMKSAIRSVMAVLRLFACGVLVTTAAGCVSQRKDLVQTSYLSLEPTLTATLSHPPEVFESDGALVVEGRLDSGDVTKGGHIDVWVRDPNGITLYEAAVNFRRPSARTQTGGPRSASRATRTSPHATYSVRFPGLPPEGSVVHVKYDPEPHAGPDAGKP